MTVRFGSLPLLLPHKQILVQLISTCLSEQRQTYMQLDYSQCLIALHSIYSELSKDNLMIELTRVFPVDFINL